MSYKKSSFKLNFYVYFLCSYLFLVNICNFTCFLFC